MCLQEAANCYRSKVVSCLLLKRCLNFVIGLKGLTREGLIQFERLASVPQAQR